MDILTGDEGQRSHGLLHGDLGDWREVEVGVVGHDDAAEQDGHDTCQEERTDVTKAHL